MRSSSEALVAARSNCVSLVGYLAYGEAGATAHPQQWHALDPTPWNYFHAEIQAGNEDAIDAIGDDDSELHVAVYAALVICRIRADHDLPLDVPTPETLVGAGKKKGILGDLYVRWGAARTIKHIRAVRDNVDTIMASFNQWAWKPVLDFGFMRHASVVKAAQRIVESEAMSVAANEAENWMANA
jgi:hypothetical protein